MDNSQVITFDGSTVKALGNGKVGGLLVRYSTADDPDLSGEYFTKDTDFDFEDGDKTSILYHHGQDTKIGGRVIGKGTLSHTDLGIWVEGQLNLRDDYERHIYGLAEAGKLGWSSGTAGHRTERVETGKATWIKSWALGLDASLTPTPCEPRTQAIPLKSLVPTPGSTLADHTAKTLADLDDFVTRIEEYASMKVKDGRKVAKERLEAFKQVKARVESVIKLSDPGPDPEVNAMKLRMIKERIKV